MSGASQRCCCSREPNLTIGEMPSDTAASSVIAQLASARAISSMARQYEMKSPPAPPISSGNGRANSPSRGHPRHELIGKLPGLVVVGCCRRDLRLSEVANHVANVTLLVTEIEVHSNLTVARRDGLDPRMPASSM